MAKKPLLAGFPQDGDPVPDDTPPNNLDQNIDEQDDPGDADPPKPPVSELDQLKAQLATQQAEVDALRRQIPPATPKAPAAPEKDPLDTTNWDQEIFSKPGEAVKKIVEITEARVTAKLRGEYKKEQGTEKFWNSFYAKHKDLNREKDHDIVEMTLNKNLASLANIPVDKALDQLADLTRDRIMVYAGGKARKRPVVEGSSPPQDRKPTEEAKPAGSLSEVLKRRKEKRRAVGA